MSRNCSVTWLMVTGSILFSALLEAKTVEVKILKYQFIPSTIEIEKGDVVVWKNLEKRQYHSVWFKQQDGQEPDYFFPGESFQKTFDNLGDFNYECGPHPEMKGRVVVK